jgi:thymidylate synthase
MEAKTPQALYMAILQVFNAAIKSGGPTGNPSLDLTLNQIRPVSPRGQLTLEACNFVGIVNEPSPDPIKTLDEARNFKIERYTKAEFELYAKGETRASEFAKAAPFWREIANLDGTVNSCYGHLIWYNKSCRNHLTPWEWAKRSLEDDRESRQAFVRFSQPYHQYFSNKDQVCTMHGNFLIRDGYLNLTMVMRSNDVVKGLVYDMPWFCHVHARMHGELLATYPDLKLGQYTHFVHSLHVYERDFPLIQSMLGEPV